MKRRTLVVSTAVLLTGCVGGSDAPRPPEDASVPGYVVAEHSEISSPSGLIVERRLITDTEVDALSDRGLRLIATENVASITDSMTVNSVVVFFYNRGDDTTGPASARVDWAPGGDLSNRDEVSEGDYTEHEFGVERLSGGDEKESVRTSRT